MVSGAQYAAVAAKLPALNIPYVPGGRSLAGMDCDGLLRYIEEQLGLPRPDKKGANYRWRCGLTSEKGTIQDCTTRWGNVPLGTIICLRKFDGGEIKHGYTDGYNIDHVYVKVEGGLVHASASNGKVMFRDFADKEIPNGGPNTYCMRGDVVYTGTRVPSDIAEDEEAEISEEGDLPDAPSIQAPAASSYFATVSTPNGKPVNMRETPSTSCSLYKKVPSGEIVQVIGQEFAEGRTWSRVKRGSRRWYIDSDFLRKV